MSMATKALPPGPKGHALLGHLREFHRDQLGFYETCARGYGDVVPTRMAHRHVLMVFHPDGYGEVMTS
jgi:hypothetical protein